MIDKNKALQMRKEGKTLQEIGRYFGVTRERIRQKIGATTELKRDYFRNEIKKLRNQNKTVKEISDILGVGGSTIAKLAGKDWKSNLKEAPVGYRRCYKCKQNILLNNFYENSTRCISCTKERMHDYIVKNKKKIRKYYRAKYKEDPNKSKARLAVNFALKQGKIIKGECQVKDKNCRGRIEAHHYLGYEKEHWLDIEWYCSYHHRHIDGLTWGKR